MDLREREECEERRSQTEPQNAAKTPQQVQTAPLSKAQPSAAPKRPKPQRKPQADQRPAKQPSKPQEGREYLPRVQMSQRAGVSLRTLDYYKAQGLVTFWYVKGKNRVLFDVAKTLEQINAL
jgi:hypothetical protein